MRGVLPALVLVLISPAAAVGQPVSTLAELPLHLNLDDAVTVVGRDGLLWRGRVLDMTPETLVLAVRDSRQSTTALVLTANRIHEVSLRRRDSLRNGALIGFGICSVLAVAGISQDDPPVGAYFGVVLVEGGLGAAVGAGIDALFRSRVVVYRADEPRWHLALGAIRGGVVLRIRW